MRDWNKYCGRILFDIIDKIEDPWKKKSDRRKTLNILKDLEFTLKEIGNIDSYLILSQISLLVRKEYVRRVDHAELDSKVKAYLKNTVTAVCRRRDKIYKKLSIIRNNS